MTPTTPITTALRAAVERSGLSGYALAKLTGVTAPVITRWLSGERSLTLDTADRLAAGLGLTFAEPAPTEPPKKSRK